MSEWVGIFVVINLKKNWFSPNSVSAVVNAWHFLTWYWKKASLHLTYTKELWIKPGNMCLSLCKKSMTQIIINHQGEAAFYSIHVITIRRHQKNNKSQVPLQKYLLELEIHIFDNSISRVVYAQCNAKVLEFTIRFLQGKPKQGYKDNCRTIIFTRTRDRGPPTHAQIEIKWRQKSHDVSKGLWKRGNLAEIKICCYRQKIRGGAWLPLRWSS